MEKEELNNLPKGYISKKVIKGHIYYYHQWSENGKKKSKYLKKDEVEKLSKAIALRNKLKEDICLYKKLPIDNNHPLYFLMHKQRKVCEIQIDPYGHILAVDNIESYEDIPVGTTKNNKIDINKLCEWWLDRSIPNSRDRIKNLYEKLKIADVKELLTKSYGLSLSDQYWVCLKGSKINWEDINFFKNDFSEDIGRLLFGELKNGTSNYLSPDITTNGDLKKRWSIKDGKRVLLKAGSNVYRQEVFNEVIASKIMEKLGIPHVNYWIEWIKDEPYSACEDFIDENTELVSAYRIINAKEKEKNVSYYDHFLDVCKELKMKDVKENLDKMIVLDFLIANEDRHLNNFGVIRNANTLEWIGMAPIFDSGSSLGFDRIDRRISLWKEIKCKPFKSTHFDQLKLVSSFAWLDLEKLKDIDKDIREIFKDKRCLEYIEVNRQNSIIEFIKSNINRLKEFIGQSN